VHINSSLPLSLCGDSHCRPSLVLSITSCLSRRLRPPVPTSHGRPPRSDASVSNACSCLPSQPSLTPRRFLVTLLSKMPLDCRIVVPPSCCSLPRRGPSLLCLFAAMRDGPACRCPPPCPLTTLPTSSAGGPTEGSRCDIQGSSSTISTRS
jgi:hypothetical protein